MGVTSKGRAVMSNCCSKRMLLAVLLTLLVGCIAPAYAVFFENDLSGIFSPESKEHSFEGGYYYRVSSYQGQWTGIEAVVKLGTPQIDPARIDRADNQPMDSFVVYLGGNARGCEIDAGLIWEVVRDEKGKISRTRQAWRPFWRNGAWNNAPCEPSYYWYPGDVVKMSVTIVAPGKLRLTVSDVGENPKRLFVADFDAPGFELGVACQFKHVNAIAQRYREGKPEEPTVAQITGTSWLEVTLFSKDGSTVKSTPMTQAVSVSVDRPSGHVERKATDEQKKRGGEDVNIYGQEIKKTVPVDPSQKQEPATTK